MKPNGFHGESLAGCLKRAFIERYHVIKINTFAHPNVSSTNHSDVGVVTIPKICTHKEHYFVSHPAGHEPVSDSILAVLK